MSRVDPEPVQETFIGDAANTALNVVVRTLCIIAPPSFFLFLRLFDAGFDETWKDEIAGSIVFAWSGVIGYWMWTTRPWEICRLYKPAFIRSFSTQAFVLCLAALLLDGGIILYACSLASMLYWMMAGVVIARRPLLPTSFDASLISYGFVFLAFATCYLFWELNSLGMLV